MMEVVRKELYFTYPSGFPHLKKWHKDFQWIFL